MGDWEDGHRVDEGQEGVMRFLIWVRQDGWDILGIVVEVLKLVRSLTGMGNLS